MEAGKTETHATSSTRDSKMNSLLNQKQTKTSDLRVANSVKESRGRIPDQELIQDRELQDQAQDLTEDKCLQLCQDQNQELNLCPSKILLRRTLEKQLKIQKDHHSAINR